LHYAAWLTANGIDVNTLAMAPGELKAEFESVTASHPPLAVARGALAKRPQGTSETVTDAAFGRWVESNFSDVSVAHLNTITPGRLTRYRAAAGMPVVTQLHGLARWIDYRIPKASDADAAHRTISGK
jgi:hypothetical protein